MYRTFIATIAFALALPAGAETIVSPSEFEALSRGKTMYFSRNGQFYGAEQFYQSRRSLWQYTDGECSDGEWFARGDMVCFVYDHDPTPQCWHFLEKSGRYAARAEGATAEFDIEMFKIDDEPLDCKGPSVGA